MTRPTAGLSISDAIDRYRIDNIARAAGGGMRTLPKKDATPVRAKPLQLDGRDTRPRAASREGCPHCGARGDLGCDHFAPCTAADLPREARGILNEKGQLALGASHHG